MRDLIGKVCSGFTEFPAPGERTEPSASTVDGPIGWPGYENSRRRAEERTGERESVVCGTGKISGPAQPGDARRTGGVEATILAWEFGFLGGSVGRRTGDRLEDAFVRARELGTPVVSLIATGGSRMQEGMVALSQLQRIARQMALTRAAGLPLVSVLRNPTTGGGWATLGAGSDVVLAEPGAQVGFAGSRVRPEGDESAYTAESQFAAGQVDQIVEDIPGSLSRWLTLLTSGYTSAPPVPSALDSHSLPETGWEAVRAARAPGRPHADAYLDEYFEWREDVTGDRCGGVDPGVRCGFGSRDGATIAYAAQCGTATRPAGFRTAARLIRLADRLGIPVLTLVDTPGAANDAEAERAGVGAAIADTFTAIASARVPITTLVIGEGGSGGALAFAAPERTWVTKDSYFSVTSPEAAAAILKRPPGEIPQVANQLRLRPQDLVTLGLANGIV